MIKELLLVLAVVLFVTLCSIGQRASGSSLDLDLDARSSAGYSEAIAVFESDDRASLQKKADRAIDNLIRTTVGELKKRGQKTLAAQIQGEYETKYKGLIYLFKPGAKDVGSHEAILWLKNIHQKIHDVLGDKICRAIRTHDLWVLAYTIPIVFSCIDHVDFVEYYKHYSPFLGVVGYWVSYGVCVGATIGSGVMFFCGLVGHGCEMATVRFIVPITCKAAHSAACD